MTCVEERLDRRKKKRLPSQSLTSTAASQSNGGHGSVELLAVQSATRGDFEPAADEAEHPGINDEEAPLNRCDLVELLNAERRHQEERLAASERRHEERYEALCVRVDERSTAVAPARPDRDVGRRRVFGFRRFVRAVRAIAGKVKEDAQNTVSQPPERRCPRASRRQCACASAGEPASLGGGPCMRSRRRCHPSCACRVRVAPLGHDANARAGVRRRRVVNANMLGAHGVRPRYVLHGR